MPRKLNLAFFYHPRRLAVSDLVTICDEVRRLDRRINTFVLPVTEPHRWTHLKLLLRRTVTVELVRPKDLRLRRGTRLRQLDKGKIASSAVIRDAGLPIPRYEVITPETRLDEADWGPYVVVKSDAGVRGAYVRIQRTSRVRYRAPDELEFDDPGRKGPRIVQRFIYTGPHPVSYRVMTFFGEPLLCVRYDALPRGVPLAGPDGFRAAPGRTIVASAKGATIRLWHEEELLALARRVHALFPTVPLLGQDFVRDAHTGELYVLEINPNGNVWNFSGPSGIRMQQEFGLDFYSQFNALPTAARVLVEVARRHGG
jgi:hypothetical protein